MVSTVAWLLAVFIAGVYAVSLYNQYVTLKHNVTKAWSNIDVLLKQRNEELQKLVALCKPYMQYEATLFEEIARARALESTARAAGNLRQVGNTETELRKGTARLLALVERYPQPTAGESLTHVANRVTALERSIADRRTFYNNTVQLNNVAIESFPGSLFAKYFGFVQAESFHFVQAAEREAGRDV